MSDDNGFQRRKWESQDGDEDELIETQIWLPESGMPADQPLLWLVVAEPIESRGVILTIKSGAIIGRQGDIRWNDLHMSRKHAHFVLVEDPANKKITRYAVAPFNDRNGTYVNGERISHVTILNENDRVEMGNTLFVVKVLE